MKKNKLYIALFFGVVCLILVIKGFGKKQGPQEVKEKKYTGIIKNNLKTKIKKNVQDLTKTKTFKNNTESTIKSNDHVFDNIDHIESRWKKKMYQLLLYDFKLELSVFKVYRGLKEGYERDKMEAFQNLHAFLEKKHGKNFEYIPSNDEKIFQKTLRKDYLLRIKKIFGKKNYEYYLKLLNQENKLNEKKFKNKDYEYTIEM